METKDRKRREILAITDKEKKLSLFNKYLKNQELRVKSHKNILVRLRSIDSNGEYITIVPEKEIVEFEVGDKITLYVLLARYIQLDCVVTKVNPFHVFELFVDHLLLAMKARDEDRVIPPPESVWVTNIKISRVTLETELQTIPTYIKINFNDYENRMKTKFDYIKIDKYPASMDERFHIVKTTGKTVYIRDTQDHDSYTALDNDFVNFSEEIIEDTIHLMKDYKNKKIVSEIIMPILYINPSSEVSNIGFVHIQSKSKPIEYSQLMETKILTFEMIDRIRESNTVKYTDKFQVMNLSPGGIRIKVTSENLIEDLHHQPGFLFEVQFKMQAPISIYGNIRYTAMTKERHLIIGLSFNGSTNRLSDKKRYLLNIDYIKKKKL